MQKLYQRSIFIFRRDLRLQDNTGLLDALQKSTQVILIFIFDPRQVTSKNKYFGSNSFQFMLESLQDLEIVAKNTGGKIYFFTGVMHYVVSKLINELKPDAIFTNQDYTPFSLERDAKIKTVCDQAGISFVSSQDVLLLDPQDIKTKTGKTYQVFTAFYKNASSIQVREPNLKNKFPEDCFYTKKIASAVKLSTIGAELLVDSNPDLVTSGGSHTGHKILKKLASFKDYLQTRDVPSLKTTHLSAHLKFGTLSIRHVFYEIIKSLGTEHALLRQLYWRDFFSYIVYHSPYVLEKAFNSKFQDIAWQDDTKKFKLWCEGRTGFPIVDAGMRELNQTGFMHNRLRMIVASFLVKDLHINWQWGERYFAQKLADYDPAVNNGNWQWVAGTGCDAQPYFRIFNPWLQQKKFDPECLYIKKWLPEIKNLPAKVVHNWFKQPDIDTSYPKPMVEHKAAAKAALNMYYK
jgi:deoxyribodipyrimidine photo-lyase